MNFQKISIALVLIGSMGINISTVQATGGKDLAPLPSKASATTAPPPFMKTSDKEPKSGVKETPVTKNKKPTAVSHKPSEKKASDKAKKEGKHQNTVPAKPSFGGTELPENYKTISIFGDAVAMKEQAVRYIRANNPQVKLSCTVERLVDIYWQEAKLEGVRPDIALCQALVETGFFKYGGDVVYQQNNFCGLGTVGKGVKGASFKTPQMGVRAHIQHLLAYSEVKRPSTPIVDPRYELAHSIRVQKGVVDTWSGLNGTWAMGSNYCEKIMAKYQGMLNMPGGKPNLPPVDPKNKYKTNIKVRIAHILNDNKE